MLYSHGNNISDANDSIAVIAEMIVPESKVLDVGCGAGDLGRVLSGKNCSLWGIEYDAENASSSEKSGKYEKVYRLNLNDFQIDDVSEKFDYVVCADVLEHLMNPDDVVAKLKSKLNDGGHFIISVPNVSHASIKTNLLLNDWSYTELGIMDKTHLRFFTAKSLAELLSRQNLAAADCKVTTLPVDGYQPHRLKELPKEVADFVMNDVYSEVFQFIVSAHSTTDSQRDIRRVNEEHICSMQKNKYDGGKFFFEIKRLLLLKFPKLINFIQKLRQK